MNPQRNGNPIPMKPTVTKPHFVTVYETYQKNFDEAIENALQHPIWRGDPPETINAINGNKVIFEMNKTFSIMAIVGICEHTYSTGFNWKCVTAIIVNKTGEFHKTGLWTRKDRMRMTNVGNALLVGCGDRDAERSWGVSANTMTFIKEANDEDLKVVEIVRQQEAVSVDILSTKENDAEATESGAATADTNSTD